MARKKEEIDEIDQPQLEPEIESQQMKPGDPYLVCLLDGVRKMWEKHGSKIVTFIEQHPDSPQKIGFPVEIDASQMELKVTVGIAANLSEKVKDEVAYNQEDPNQGIFKEIVADDGAGPLKGESAEPEAQEPTEP